MLREWVQWVAPRPDGSFYSALVPENHQEVCLPAWDEGKREPVIRHRTELRTEFLPFPMALGLPADGANLNPRPLLGGASKERWEATFVFAVDGSDPPSFVTSAEPNPVIAMEILGELQEVIGKVALALDFDVEGVSPGTGPGEIHIFFGPGGHEKDLEVAGSLILLGAATQMLAVARGFGVVSARCNPAHGDGALIDGRLVYA